MSIFASAGIDVGGANDADATYVPGHLYSVQHCHDQFATTGDTITLPNGTFTWSTGVKLTKAVILTSANFQQATIVPGNIGSSASTYCLQITKSTGIAYTSPSGAHASVRVTGLNFTATSASNCFKHLQISELAGATSVSASSIYQISSLMALVDNNVFTCGPFLTGGQGQFGAIGTSANGCVIAWNTFYNTNTGNNAVSGFDAGGIECHNPGGGALDPSWQSFDSMGINDTNGNLNIYIEQNTFNALLDQGLDHADASRVVFRSNTMNDSSTASHGQDSGVSGGRHLELYNNRYVFHTSGPLPSWSASGGNYPLNIPNWHLHRAATGIITTNVMPDIISSFWGTKSSIVMGVFNINVGPNQIPCQTSYPAARQPGQTWIGTVSGFSPHGYATIGTTAVDGPTSAQLTAGQGYYTDPIYIWNNSGGTSWQTLSLIDQTTSVGSTCAAFCNWINSHGGSGCTGSYSLSYVGNGAPGAWITAGIDVVFNPKISGPTGGWTQYTFPHPLNPGQPGGNITVSLSGNSSVTGIPNPGISASGVTSTTEAAIVRTIVGATGGYTIPANNFASLYSTQFSSAKAGATEWSGGSYARQAMGASAAGWTIAAYANGVGVVWNNANLINFPATLTSQMLFSLGFCDALNVGNIDFFIDLAFIITVSSGISVTLPASTGAVFTTY